MTGLIPEPAIGPLAFQQERPWFLQRIDPLSMAYGVPVALRIRGRLRPDAIQAGLDEARRRHEVLRARFIDINGRPAQAVESERPVVLRVADLTTTPPQRRPRAAMRLARAEASRPFHLAREDLVRALRAPARFSQPEGVDQLYKAQARPTPQRPALMHGSKQITCGALDPAAKTHEPELRDARLSSGTRSGLTIVVFRWV